VEEATLKIEIDKDGEKERAWVQEIRALLSEGAEAGASPATAAPRPAILGPSAPSPLAPLFRILLAKVEKLAPQAGQVVLVRAPAGTTPEEWQQLDLLLSLMDFNGATRILLPEGGMDLALLDEAAMRAEGWVRVDRVATPSVPADVSGQTQCLRCKQIKLVTEFFRLPGKLSLYCKPCERARIDEWRKKRKAQPPGEKPKPAEPPAPEPPAADAPEKWKPGREFL
jgi:hypothetical protein